MNNNILLTEYSDLINHKCLVSGDAKFNPNKKSKVSQVLTKKLLGVFCINLFQILSVSTQIRISMDRRPNRYSRLLDGMFGKLSLVTESC